MVKRFLKKVEQTVSSVKDAAVHVVHGAGELVTGDIGEAWDEIWVEGIQGDLESGIAHAGSGIVGIIDEELGEDTMEFLDEWGVEVALAVAGAYYAPSFFASEAGRSIASTAASRAPAIVTQQAAQTGAWATAKAAMSSAGSWMASNALGLTSLSFNAMQWHAMRKESKLQAELAKKDARRAAEYSRAEARRSVREVRQTLRRHQSDLSAEAKRSQLASGGIAEGSGMSGLLAANRARAEATVKRILTEGEKLAKDYESQLPDIDRSRRYRDRATDIETLARGTDTAHRYGFFGNAEKT